MREEKHSIQKGISYFGNRILKHVQADLEEIANSGFTYVVHTFSENDYEFYRLTLREIVEATHQIGLKVYLDPWGVGRLFGGEAYSSFLCNFPRTWQVLSDGSPVPAACPNHPAFQAFVKNWINAAVDIGADVILWDEPHLYVPKDKCGHWACHCSYCRDLFKRKYDTSMPEQLTYEVLLFRQDCVIDFLREMGRHVESQRVKNCVVLLPNEELSTGIRDWHLVAALDEIDIIGSSPFWLLCQKDLDEFVGHFSQKVVHLCNQYHKESQIWIQAFKVPGGAEPQLTKAVEIAVRAGVKNLAAWGYLGCEHMSSIRSEMPDRVWQTLKEVFTSI